MNMSLPPWETEGAAPANVKEAIKGLSRDIFNQIASGKYSFGARLPSERQLADEFGQSRAAVRQAIELLDQYEVVSKKSGGGAYVAFRPVHINGAPTILAHELLDITAIAESASPFEMGIICSIIEPEMVRLATLYMSVKDIGRIKKLMGDIEAIVTDAQKFAELEKQFLMAIAEGTHNRLLVTLYRVITAVRQQPHWCATHVASLSPGRILDGQKKLRSLFDALERRDVEAAVEFMKLIITDGHNDVI